MGTDLIEMDDQLQGWTDQELEDYLIGYRDSAKENLHMGFILSNYEYFLGACKHKQQSMFNISGSTVDNVNINGLRIEWVGDIKDRRN